MTTYVTSDTHFNHTNIIQYCNRPYADVEDMNRQMIANWNAVVRPNDTVWHMGDIFMGQKTLWPELRAQLNGRIHVWQGNHDAPDDKFRAALHTFDVVNQETVQIYNGLRIWCAHAPVAYFDDRVQRLRGVGAVGRVGEAGQMAGHSGLTRTGTWIDESLGSSAARRCT